MGFKYQLSWLINTTCSRILGRMVGSEFGHCLLLGTKSKFTSSVSVVDQLFICYAHNFLKMLLNLANNLTLQNLCRYILLLRRLLLFT